MSSLAAERRLQGRAGVPATPRCDDAAVCLLGASKRFGEVTALEDTMLLRIPGPQFLEALSKLAPLGLALSRFLATRLRTFAEHFGHITALQARARRLWASHHAR